ncbi:MAG: GGDEF domain-containing protein [Spirochaetaceae bacterium]|nr:MAG: GGDEF domain-containing protein [Spirochaetaceae bacterium]
MSGIIMEAIMKPKGIFSKVLSGIRRKSQINDESGLLRTIDELKAANRDLADQLERKQRIESAMTLYFDTLYDELIKHVEEKEKDHFIDRVMEMVYDNIHLAFDDMLKVKNRELDEAKGTLAEIDNHMHNVILERTKALNEENRKLHELAITDELTGLSNRRGFLLLAERYLREMGESGGEISLFFIDLDNFKMINDRYGHNEGDWLLKRTAWIFHKSLRGDDIICRYGGDEFAIFMKTADVERVLARIREYTNEFNRQGERPYTLSFSVGHVTAVAGSSTDLQSLVSEADKNMYRDKTDKKKSDVSQG